MTRTTGATPLIALACAAIDTETTGLDTAEARIVEFGAIGIASGAIDRSDRFNTLVDPGLAVPGTSTAVHGITNAMVRDAPDFARAYPRFLEFVGARIVVGYSIGFDFAVIERECRRHGLAWSKPRALCVRLLAAVLAPPLPDHGLDTLAAWLGVTVEGRHRAAGDAEIAAELFVRLLPKLQERGIRTLAEAERACLSLSEHLETHHRAGWTEPVTRPDPDRLTGLGAVDPYAYRHRVSELMSSPPVVVPAGADLRSLVRTMTANRISSVFVSERAQPGRPLDDYGIVTERDIMRRIAADGMLAFDRRADEIASRPLASIRAEAFVYRAIGRMDRLRIRHLAVRDTAGNLAGIVSARDLLGLRAGAAICLDDAILAAASAPEMAAAWATLPSVAHRLIAEDVDGRTIAEIVSEELRALTRRAAELAEDGMKAEGKGRAPCPYAFVVLGSGGRGESLLAADQDNAVIFAHGRPDGAEDAWFADFGARIADTLDIAGVPLCKGGVMARNPDWRGSLESWRQRAEAWIRRGRPADLLNVDIFFDMRAVHGRLALAEDLLSMAQDAARGDIRFAKLLAASAENIPDPFSLFGGIASENGRIDLKRFGLFPIVAAARVLAIRHGIRARSTRERLAGLKALDLGAVGDLDRLTDGHAFLLGLLLEQQSRDLHAGIAVSNRVELASLSQRRLARLKVVLRDVQRVPMLLRDLMFG